MNIKDNVLKMTQEEIEEVELKVENLTNAIEISKIQIRQFNNQLKTGYFEKQAKVDIYNLKKELVRQEQNLRVFKRQIKTRIFQTI